MHHLRLQVVFTFVLILFTFLINDVRAGELMKDEMVNYETHGRKGNAVVFSHQQRVWLEAKYHSAYSTYPITVECWAKLKNSNNFNIIIANDYKDSSKHWEIYSRINTGVLCVFLPGYEVSDIVSDKKITDNKWHYIAMTFDGVSVQLFVDAEKVKQAQVEKLEKTPNHKPNGPLMLGQTMVNENNYLLCEGMVDEVRLSNNIREITTIPGRALNADTHTIGLWDFDDGGNKGMYRDHASLNNPFVVVNRQPRDGISLDQIDIESYKAGPSPLDTKAVKVDLKKSSLKLKKGPDDFYLNGQWEMAEGGLEARRLAIDWTDSMPAHIPGSVHSALVANGRIPDPMVGLNDTYARDKSFKTWWFKKKFKLPKEIKTPCIVFGGIAIKADIWLNGHFLGSHEGMFGGPSYDISKHLKDENTMIIRIHPAPYVIRDGDPNPFFTKMNVGWLFTVVFNNCYGWHYSNIPAIGLWQSVLIEDEAAIEIKNPFVATVDAEKGIVDIVLDLDSQFKKFSGKLKAVVEPENFKGDSYSFTLPVTSSKKEKQLHIRTAIPNPQLWWPNDLGKPNLYRMKLSFTPEGAGTTDYQETTFGIRTIEMGPTPDGPRSDMYNWTFIVNGQPMYVKGNGWCTMDTLMDFSRQKYDRFLTLAQDQHIQMIRAWGSGMPETFEFFDLCDRKGLMVMQEWPTAWNSHRECFQPYDMLEETVRLNTLRLRNHPSLVMWGGGNESDHPFGKAIDMMGRYSIELDGTRPFHRGEPWGGSFHNYDVYWGRKSLDHNLKWDNFEKRMKTPGVFIGEFGLACMPAYESVQRYLPDDEKNLWPVPTDDKRSLAHHTPIFNTAEDLDRLKQYAYYFVPEDASMEMFTIGSQLSQATGVRHTLELGRTRWPNCTGTLYYKMNDNYPAASWSSVDWYGTPKISHYVFQDSFAPLHACVIFDRLNFEGKDIELPVYLLDDADQLKGGKWQVIVRAYNASLDEVKNVTFDGTGSIQQVVQVGTLTLTQEQTKSNPLFIIAETVKRNKIVDRTFYWTNYEAVKGCLFNLPATKLSMSAKAKQITVKNIGRKPAVAVNLSRPGHLDTFRISDNYFWLDAGESKTVTVNSTDNLTLSSWNKN